jgi:hypothetical protein
MEQYEYTHTRYPSSHSRLYNSGIPSCMPYPQWPRKAVKACRVFPKSASSRTIAFSSVSQNSACFAKHTSGLFNHTIELPVLSSVRLSMISEYRPRTSQHLATAVTLHHHRRIARQPLPQSHSKLGLWIRRMQRQYVHAGLYYVGSHQVPARASKTSPRARTAFLDGTHFW